ncbi:PVC-type heme-binding CxxCH protein [Candidatus Laterigemmans baculatus]|uniref:PVC-type heme-binding CxxCH protein n=1 Tax=Candidatus Laterigemmans baculatus TaxID=2770505 RepID=UPI0013DBD443|nr:PVC-type heme-binding CxxCH protein [Candidatus Laterigemmans baculatus]
MNASVPFAHLGAVRILLGFLVASGLVASGAASTAARAAEHELRDGDRVVLLGDGLIEQEQYFGWIEVMMTSAFPERHVTFRNLGWNGDTPAGDSRFGLSLLQAGREPTDEGWKQLQQQLELTRPTVLVLGYGMASSLEGGAEGLAGFVRNYQRLLETAREISPDVRFIFLSPLQRLDTGHPHAAVLARYANAIRRLAAEHSSPFVDLTTTALEPAQRKDPIHVNEQGYRAVAAAIASALEWGDGAWQENPLVEPLREVILRKNQWWFHRSRPANMAYVFGFRKHEQGQNAAEIPQFDKLIETEEQRIAALRGLQPVAVQEPIPRTESRYAEFTPQATPEFTLGEDLEVTLWAENPLLNKPIQINFDPEGRLWVASSEAYPMIEVGQSAPDKILVLEDSDGDGKADQSTVFAEGLLIPTGVQPGDGGVYVAQSTDLLHLKDTDGDGKADVKRRVLSGFGTEDTHHNLHTLLWGPDGRLYMNQSVYTRTDTETPHGVVRLKAGGGFRYNTDSMRMQIFFRGLWNAWGHQFNEYGQSFLTDGAGFAGIAYAFPGAAFNPAPGTRRQLDLISPGSYPKFCSLEIVSGDSFPPEWQNSIITCDFRANRVVRFSLQQQDAGYVTQQEDDLMRTSASTFRPIDVKQGPDGALYIADWSNPIINHGEVDFRDERRDRWHGRIWRVSWKGAKAKPKVNLRELETPQLLDNLLSKDRFTSDQSRRVLLERGGIEPEVDQWMSQQQAPAARLQGMWLYQALGALDKLPYDLLDCEDGRIRAAAVRVLSDFADPATDHPQRLEWAAAEELLARRVVDEHPHVRLEAIRALGAIGTAEAALLALESLAKPMDRFLEYALATTIEESAEPLMTAIESGAWTADTPTRERQLAFILTSIDPARAGRFVAEQLEQRPLSRDGSGPWIELIGKAGGPDELRQLYGQLLADGFEADAAVRALGALADAARLRQMRPNDLPAGIGTLIDSDKEAIQRAAIQLAGVWKLGGQIPALTGVAARSEAAAPLRLAALEAMRNIGGQPAADALAKLASSDPDRTIRQRAVVLLAALDAQRAPQPFYALLAQLPSEEEALELWRQMLSGQGVGQVLAANLPSEGISTAAARAGVRASRDGGREEPELLAALLPLSEMSLTAEKMTPERVQELIRKVAAQGDPAHGEKVYMREALACIHCHAIGGVGGKVGPDMTSLGASAPVDYLIESLFDPSAKIKEGYHAVTVLSDDGTIVSGIETESTDAEMVLRDANDKLVRIPKAEIVGTKPGQSLMPTGVVDRLTEQEQIDLISFLSKLGKPGEFDASRGGVARLYQVLAGTHRVEQEAAGRIVSGELEEGWKPLQSRVNGTVDRETLAALTEQPPHIALVHVYLRTEIEASQAGSATLTIHGTDSATLWIDGKQIEGAGTYKTQLDAGRHTVLVRLDARDLPNQFRLTSNDVTFATE